MKRPLFVLVVALAALSLIEHLAAQAPAGQPQAPAGGRGRGGTAAPGRGQQAPPIDPAVLERGRGLYSVSCASCHGSEARGGETGPNLLRSPFVLDDRDGETLLPIIRSGRPDRGMPSRSDLTEQQVKDIAAFLRSVRTTGPDPGRRRRRSGGVYPPASL